MKIFISYSHHDEQVVERLITHMAALRREGLVQAWYDRKISAGETLDDEIFRELEESDIVLLIVSADFINSDYCYERELKRALEKAKAGELIVIPVIAEACDWHSTLGQLKAIPKDGKPVSEWQSQNTALLLVVQEIRQIVETANRSAGIEKRADKRKSAPVEKQRQYRVKRDFDKIDKAEFIENSFSEVRDFFRKASEEIGALDGIKARFRQLNDTEFECHIVNQNKVRGSGYILVRSRARSNSMFGDIDFSYSENSSSNSSNGGFSADPDDYEFAWIGRMSFSMSEKRLTTTEMTEALWGDFVKQAGISHA